MLLKPKKKKEYRYSKDLNVLHESLSPLSSKVSLAGSTRSFKDSELKQSKRAGAARREKQCCDSKADEDEVSAPCTRLYCNIF